MLSRLDDIIYPNRCEVIEIKSSQRYIYPIFKNARSSLYEEAHLKKYKILFNEQLKRIDSIDVILRNPEERFISGVNTFVWNLITERPNFSKDTILYFVENYLFLNRHYAPQLSWMINLFRYTTEETKFNFVGMDKLSEYTAIHAIPNNEDKILDNATITRLKNNVDNQHYLKLDKSLLTLVNNSWTRKQILAHLMNREPTAFFETIGKSNTIIGVTDVLS